MRVPCTGRMSDEGRLGLSRIGSLFIFNGRSAFVSQALHQRGSRLIASGNLQ